VYVKMETAGLPDMLVTICQTTSISSQKITVYIFHLSFILCLLEFLKLLIIIVMSKQRNICKNSYVYKITSNHKHNFRIPYTLANRNSSR
jgi:hypothetical protein